MWHECVQVQLALDRFRPVSTAPPFGDRVGVQDWSGTASALPPIAIAPTPATLRFLDEVDLGLRSYAAPPREIGGGSPPALEERVLPTKDHVIHPKTVVAVRAPEALEKDAWRML
jgi:hypothetical protein